MRRGDGVRILLPAVLAAVLLLSASCVDNLPGTIEVTITSQAALDGITGDLRIEVHEGTPSGDLRGLYVESLFTLNSAAPIEVTMEFVSPGDHVVVAWLDVSKNRYIDTTDVVSLCGCPPVTVPPRGTVSASIDLDTIEP